MISTPDVEVGFVTLSSDPTLEADLKATLPDSTISVADQFTGAAEIAVFFKVGADVLKTLLNFVNANRARMKAPRLIIGKGKVELEGYTADQVEKLMASDGFQKAMASLGPR